jgi:hypothetical protein
MDLVTSPEFFPAIRFPHFLHSLAPFFVGFALDAKEIRKTGRRAEGNVFGPGTAGKQRAGSANPKSLVRDPQSPVISLQGFTLSYALFLLCVFSSVATLRFPSSRLGVGCSLLVFFSIDRLSSALEVLGIGAQW